MSFSGTYNLTINTPMGKQESVLVLSDEGGALTGTMEAQGEKGEIKNASIDGDTATWDVDVPKPMPMTLSFTAKKAGDGLEGSVKLGAFGNAAFEGAAA